MHHYSSMGVRQKEMTHFLFSCPSICPSNQPASHPSIHLYVQLYKYPPSLPFSYLPIPPSIYPLIYLSIYPSKKYQTQPMSQALGYLTQIAWFLLSCFSESSGRVSCESKNHIKYD